jgi:hypothetical protein
VNIDNGMMALSPSLDSNQMNDRSRMVPAAAMEITGRLAAAPDAAVSAQVSEPRPAVASAAPAQSRGAAWFSSRVSAT